MPESLCYIYRNLDFFDVSNNLICSPYPECFEFIGFQNTDGCSSLDYKEKVDINNIYVNSINHNGEVISTEANYSNEMLKSKIGFKIPKFLDPVKKRAFFLNEKKSQENKIKKIKNLNLRPYQIRNLLSGKFEIDHTLFDDKVRIPLLFYGKNVESGKSSINDMV